MARLARFEARFAHAVLRHRRLVIALAVLVVAACTFGARHLYLDTSYEVFFTPDNPQLADFLALERTYVKDDNVLIVLAPRDGEVFTARTLAAIEDLTARAWQTPYSHRVDSITNFQATRASGDDLIVENMVTNAAALTRAELTRLRARVLAEPSLRKRLIADDGKVTAINVKVHIPAELATRMTPVVVAAVRDLVAAWQVEHPHIATHLTGIIVMDNAFAEASAGDMRLLIPVSFAVMLATLALLVAGVAGSLATLAVIGLSTVAAMGLGGYAGVPITPPTSVAPIIILTVAIANCVHLLCAYREEVAARHDRVLAMEHALARIFLPVVLCAVTTVVGFLTLNFSDIPPFKHLGTLVAAGVVVAQALALTFLPALLTYLPLAPELDSARHARIMTALAEFVLRHHRRLLWLALGVTLALCANVPRNELNDSFIDYFSPSMKFRQDTDFTLENLTGLYTVHFSLAAGDSGAISEPAFLADVEAFARWLEQQPEVLHVDRVTTVLRRLNLNMHGDDPTYDRLPDSRELAAQYLLLYEMSLPYGLDLNNQIDVDKSRTKVSMILKSISSNQMLALEQRALDWLAAHAVSVHAADVAGTALMFSHIGRRNIRSMIVGTVLGVGLIAAILVIALRSLRIGLLSLVPNLVPAAMGFGLWGLFVGEIGLSLSLVTSMTLGIVIDDTIHFLANYLRARRELGLCAEDVIRQAFATVGRAVFVTSIALVLGFLVLAQSSFKLNSGMGSMAALIIALALAAEYLLMPPLLMFLDGKFKHDALPARHNPPARAA